MSAAQTVGILLGPTLDCCWRAPSATIRPFWWPASPGGGRCAGVVLPAAPRDGLSSEAAPRAATAQLFTRPLLLAYSLQIILATTQGVGAAVWTIYMADLGASPLVIGLSFTTFAIPIILLAPIAGRMADRHGRYWYVLFGLSVCGVLFVIYGLPINPIWLVILSVPEGVAAAFARTAADGLLADATPPSLRGRIQATYSAAGTGQRIRRRDRLRVHLRTVSRSPLPHGRRHLSGGRGCAPVAQVARMFAPGAFKKYRLTPLMWSLRPRNWARACRQRMTAVQCRSAAPHHTSARMWHAIG